MKKFSLYFYAGFILFAIVAALISLVFNEPMGYIVLAQLIWGPISILHCFALFIGYPKGKTKKHINISFGITIAYFVILFFNSYLYPYLYDNNMLTFGYLFVLPWLMLSYFTYIQYLILKD